MHWDPEAASKGSSQTAGCGQKQPNGIKAKVSRERSFAEGL
jgi:hypothetical protein